MMAQAAPKEPISFFYRLLFLYIEPLVAFLGGLQALLDPSSLLSVQTPTAAPYYRSELRPLTTHISGGWFLLAFYDAVLLRTFPRNATVWRIAMAGSFISDLLYLAGIWQDWGNAKVFDVMTWTPGEAFTLISTLIPFVAKITGMLGLGINTSSRDMKTRKAL